MKQNQYKFRLSLSLTHRAKDGRGGGRGELEEGELAEPAEPQLKKKKEDLDPLLTRTGTSLTLSC